MPTPLSTRILVVAIASLGACADNVYHVRSEVAQSLAEVTAARLELWEAAYAARQIPKTFRFSSKFSAPVASVDWLDQAVVLTFSERAAKPLRGQTLAMGACVDPKNRQEIIGWSCALSACKEGVPLVDAAVRTTVAAKYLPNSCR
jgi:hypothetical protein